LLGVPSPPMTIAFHTQHLSRSTMLMLSLGAGIYEELLFRVVLVGLLAWGAKKLLGLRPLVAGIAATVIGALIFSAFHYIGPFGDRFEVYSFVFRAVFQWPLPAPRIRRNRMDPCTLRRVPVAPLKPFAMLGDHEIPSREAGRAGRGRCPGRMQQEAHTAR
jgi:hypothetical protein